MEGARGHDWRRRGARGSRGLGDMTAWRGLGDMTAWRRRGAHGGG